MKRIISILMVVVMLFGLLSKLSNNNIYECTVAAEEVVKNIGVDINGNENRQNLYSPDFYSWQAGLNLSIMENEFEGISFKIYSATGEIFRGYQNKTLAKADGTTPYITCDGIVMSSNIVLEIAGLSAGEHTLTTWHSYFNYSGSASSLSELDVTINDTYTTRVTPSIKAATDLEATIAYQSFTVEEGQTAKVVISLAKDATGAYKDIVLNGFELDGAHPTKSVKTTVPENNEEHHDEAEGLSWTPADGAVSHNVYLGTEKDLVSAATTDSDEFMGNVTDCAYNFTEELDHMETYYWRVDGIFEDGTVVKGKVMRFQVRHLAFPSAEGYGRFAKGGRGGQVLEVTTLEDYGSGEKVIEGSLRWALTEVSGPRIIVFRVGGVIELKRKLNITEGNFYLAGQTAPGDGITVIKYNLGCSGCEDVIIRNIRVRVGDSNGTSTDGMGLGSCSNSIIDHCSMSWATDEGFSSRDAKDITFQYNIIGESLHDSVHYNGDDRTQTETHAFAATIGGDIGSFHHNLLINCTGRNWSLRGTLESDNKTYYGKLDISNNVVYNWYNRTTDGGNRRTNFVNNYYKMGHQSIDIHFISLSDKLTDYDCMAAYVSGNVMQRLDGSFSATADDDAWEIGKALGSPTGAYTLEDMKSDEPFFLNYITLETAEEAYDTVIENVGAIYPQRDYIDSRYISEVVNTTYTYRGSKQGLLGIIDSQNDVGGYPNSDNFKHATTPEDFDKDHDGISDEWELLHGLDPTDPSDSVVFTLSNEGYTNIELYLNELMGDDVVYANEDATPTVTPTPETTSTPEATSTPDVIPTELVYTLGDVNSDGNVDAADALLTLQHAAKLIELDATQKLAADVVTDDLVDAKDALEILKYAAKVISEFLMNN